MKSETDNTLKPCPFCGGDIELTAVDYEWTFCCFECESRTNFGLLTYEDAIAAWNKRVKNG
ncbi:MAG: Lar family restriction alleviation protein [Treponema sp.]|nr:Lar family restriction alleviation protein [Treponema sp.]